VVAPSSLQRASAARASRPRRHDTASDRTPLARMLPRALRFRGRTNQWVISAVSQNDRGCIAPQDRARAGLGAPFRLASYFQTGQVADASAGLPARWPWAVRLDYYWRWLLDGSSRDARPADHRLARHFWTIGRGWPMEGVLTQMRHLSFRTKEQFCTDWPQR
jgi:hypothetical protein